MRFSTALLLSVLAGPALAGAAPQKPAKSVAAMTDAEILARSPKARCMTSVGGRIERDPEGKVWLSLYGNNPVQYEAYMACVKASGQR